MRRPLVPLAVSLAAGILADQQLGLAPEAWAWAALVGLAVSAVLGCLAAPAARLGVLLGCSSVGGLLHADASPDRLPPQHLRWAAGQGPLRVEAVVVSALRAASEGRSQLQVEALYIHEQTGVFPTAGRVRLTLGASPRPVPLPGDRVLFRARLRRPRGFVGPGSRDPWLALQRQGLSATVYLEDPRALLVVGRLPGWQWQRLIAAHAGRVRALLDRVAADHPDRRGLLGALTLGERGGLDARDRAAFQDTGAAHILAISGLHLGLAVGILFGAARWLLARSEFLLLRLDVWRWSAGLAVLGAWAYVALSGAAPSSQRAALVASCVLGARALSRRGDWPSALALAALVMLVHRPGSLFDPSFQLSFVAVLALWGFGRGAGPVKESSLLPSGLPGLLRRLFGQLLRLMMISTVASVATAPIVAGFFQRSAPLALVGNLLLVPPVAFLLVPLCLSITLLAPWPALSIPLAELAQGGAGLVLAAARRLAALPLGAGAALWASPSLVALWYLVLLCAALARWGHPRCQRWSWLCVVLLWGGWAWESRPASGRLEVVVLDVGHGDATLFRLPGGEVVLVDAGSGGGRGSGAGRRAVVPALLRLGIRALDLVVVTHPHADHCGGLEAVARSLRIRELWLNGDQPGRGCELALGLARQAAGRHRVVAAGEERRFAGGVSLQVLHPPAPVGAELQGNDRSIVLRLSYGSLCMLWTGDIEQEAERVLVRAYPGQLRCAILKVPHHGSRTSSGSSLLDSVQPRLAVLSARAGGRGRGAHPEVLARYQSRGVKLLRTDVSGSVTLRIEAQRYSATPWAVAPTRSP